MAIRGSLKEAGLADVIQLLFLGRRTGCLSLADRQRHASVFFEDGWIIYAAIVNRRDRLGDSSSPRDPSPGPSSTTPSRSRDRAGPERRRDPRERRGVEPRGPAPVRPGAIEEAGLLGLQLE